MRRAIAMAVMGASCELAVLQDSGDRWPPRRSLTCPVCEYDLRESTSSVCTECGNHFEATCAACGRALQQIATGTCPDCRSVFTPDAVLIRPRAV